MWFLIRQTIIFTSLCGRPGTDPGAICMPGNSGTNRLVGECRVSAPFCKLNITFCTINNLLFRILESGFSAVFLLEGYTCTWILVKRESTHVHPQGYGSYYWFGPVSCATCYQKLFPACGLFSLFYICILYIIPIRQIDHPFIPLCFHWRLRQILPCSIYNAQILVSLK